MKFGVDLFQYLQLLRYRHTWSLRLVRRGPTTSICVEMDRVTNDAGLSNLLGIVGSLADKFRDGASTV
jgi:hypothetical protein